MKTNCPHCQGQIVIPVHCCNGDDAIQCVFTPMQYEKIQIEAEEQKLAKKAKKELFEKELEDFITMNATSHQRFWFSLSLLSNKFFTLSLLFLLVSVPLGLVGPSYFPHSEINLVIAVTLLFAFAVFFLLALIPGAAECEIKKTLQKKFIKLHHEYAEFDV